MPKITPYKLKLRKEKLQIPDLAHYMEEHYLAISLEELYEVILVLGKLQQRSLLAKRLVTFLKRRQEVIAEEAKKSCSNHRRVFNPHESVIVDMLRQICNKSCTKTLMTICTKILVRLGFSIYSDMSRFKYKVYRMNMGKDGTLQDQLNTINYEFSEDGPFTEEDTLENEESENNTLEETTVASYSSEIRDLITSEVRSQYNQTLSRYLAEHDIRKVISEEIHRVIVHDVLPIFKQCLPNYAYSNCNTSYVLENPVNTETSCNSPTVSDSLYSYNNSLNTSSSCKIQNSFGNPTHDLNSVVSYDVPTPPTNAEHSGECASSELSGFPLEMNDESCGVLDTFSIDGESTNMDPCNQNKNDSISFDLFMPA